MYFTHATLTSTRKHFSEALGTRGLSLPFQTELNLWAKIVTGKSFSQAASSSNASGHINAIAISGKSIQHALKGHSREVSVQTAIAIFTDAIRHDVRDVSYCLAELVGIVASADSRCLIQAGDTYPRIGLMDTEKAGYLALARLPIFEAMPRESAWITGSAGLAVDVVNELAGRNSEECMTIFATNHRLADEKSNRVFTHRIALCIDVCAETVAEGINRRFDPADVKNWEAVDYDMVRDIVYDAFAATVGDDRAAWLSMDCDVAEAAVDHVAARIRDGMKWQSYAANDGTLDDVPLAWVAHTTHLSIAKMFNIPLPGLGSSR